MLKLCKRKCQELERNTKDAKRVKSRPCDKHENGLGEECPRIHVVDEANSSISMSSSPLHSSPQQEEETKDLSLSMSRSMRQQPVKAYDKGIQQRRSNSLPNSMLTSAGSCTGSLERDRSTDRLQERSMECWVTSPPPLSVDKGKKKETSAFNRNVWALSASPRRKLSIPRTSDSDNESDSGVDSTNASETESPVHQVVPNGSVAVHRLSGNLISPSDTLQDYRVPSSKIARKLMLPNGSVNGRMLKGGDLGPKVSRQHKKAPEISAGLTGTIESLVDCKLEDVRSQFITVVAALEQLSELPNRINQLENEMKASLEAMNNRIIMLDNKLDVVTQRQQKAKKKQGKEESGRQSTNHVLKEKTVNRNKKTEDFIDGIEERYKKTEQFIKTFDLTT